MLIGIARGNFFDARHVPGDEAAAGVEHFVIELILADLVLDARAPFCACEGEPTLDRIGVDGRVFRTWPMRGWGPDGRRMLTLMGPAATGSGGANAHNEVVRGVAYEREEELLESFNRAARGLLEDGSLA